MENRNVLGIKVPYEYAESLVNLNWYDISFGIREKIFQPIVAKKHAWRVFGIDEVTPELEYLTYMSEGEAIYPELDRLAAKVPEEKEETIEKFCYILLSWVCDHPEIYHDQLDIAEYIYADYGYPREVSKFIRYMPSDKKTEIEKSLGENLQQLMTYWKEYLESKKQRWKH